MAVTQKDLNAAIAKGESFVQRLIALKPGQSEARAVRFDGNKAKIADIAAEAERLASIIRPAVARAQQQTGLSYKVERMTNVSTGKDGFALVVVTCGK